MNFNPQSTFRTPQSMVLIYPPVVKPCEPPSGIARLCGALNRHGIRCSVIDANLEGILGLLENPGVASDTWTRRAYRHLEDHLNLLKGWEGYRNIDRYTRAIKDINRVLEKR